MASKKSKLSNDECYVERVLKKRIHKGKEEYLIKWYGYDK
jgi:hypothetical protein